MKLKSSGIQSRFGKFANLITFPYHVAPSIGQGFLNTRVCFHVRGKLRRFWRVHFQKDYVQRQISRRVGTCRQCATCCNLLCTCPLLTNQGSCLGYDICRPGACKIFPIDQRDIDEVELCGKHCGYHFDQEKFLKIL